MATLPAVPHRSLAELARPVRPVRPSRVLADTPAMTEPVYREYPALRSVDPLVIDSRDQPSTGGGLEFYPPDEAFNPLQGTTAIELFDRRLRGRELQDALAGDMLHGLPAVDPQFARMREQFRQSITPEQEAFDRRKFADEGAPHDTFDSWMDRSMLDAYLRGYLFPDRNDEWRKQGVYTPEQMRQLDEIRQHLRKRNP